MASAYDQAVATLYQAPHESFVEQRKRLAAELKSAGDKAGAARFAKLGRPTISAWAVNQLWWQARGAFDELFETAAQLRAGKLSASGAHRKAVAKLTTEAQKLLKASGHGSADATLRRITMTLSGLAASGSFEPEEPGALTKDRDPPGFEAFGIASSGGESQTQGENDEPRAAPAKKAKPAARDKHDDAAELEKRHAVAEAERTRQAAVAERARQAERRAARQAKRRELESALREANTLRTEHEQERTRLQKELVNAERLVERASAEVEKAEERLASFDAEP